MKKLLPDLKGKKVLMLGCGTGEESLLLEENNAINMIGVDLSAESVRLANESYPNHSFVVGDMHKLHFSNEEFDMVYSSLTIHYSATPARVYEEAYRLLKPGGRLQFSVGHPMRWASGRIDVDGNPAKIMGYTEGDKEPRLYGSYSEFREYEETFVSGEVLKFWIGPPSMHFELLKQTGFMVTDFVETRATEECRKIAPYYYQRFNNFPQFSIFSALK